MARRCTVCLHPELDEINRRLLLGDSIAGIARDSTVSEDALSRHKWHHLTTELDDIHQTMVEAREEALAEVKQQEVESIKERKLEGMAARLENAKTHFDQLREVRIKAATLLDKAEESEDLKTASIFLRELREQIKLMAELEGKLEAQPQVNVLVNPQWIELRTLIIRALEPYPEAKEAVIHAALSLGNTDTFY